MPEIKVILTPGELNDYDTSNKIVVVIDTLRASTTIITALSSGMKAVIPFSSLNSLYKYYYSKRDLDRYILVGESGGRNITGLDYGNSPLSFLDDKFLNIIMLLKTSNGSRVLKMLRESKLILVGALVNSQKICSVIFDRWEDVYLVCAGSNGTFSLEDFFAAGRYCFLLKKAGWKGDDLTVAAARIYEDNSYYDDIVKLFYLSRNGQNLLDLGYEDDIKFSSKVDIFDIAPVFDGEKIVRNDSLIVVS